MSIVPTQKRSDWNSLYLRCEAKNIVFFALPCARGSRAEGESKLTCDSMRDAGKEMRRESSFGGKASRFRSGLLFLPQLSIYPSCLSSASEVNIVTLYGILNR